MAALSVCFYGNGEDYFAVCRYLDETHAEIDGVRYAVREFAGGWNKTKSAMPLPKGGAWTTRRIDIFMEQIVLSGGGKK